MDDLQERVKRGAEWLDRERPGWREKIDLAVLALTDCSKCVLGQVFADLAMVHEEEWGYDAATRKFGDGPSFDEREAWAVRHGFNVASDLRWPDRENAWVELQRLWEKEVSR